MWLAEEMFRGRDRREGLGRACASIEREVGSILGGVCVVGGENKVSLAPHYLDGGEVSFGGEARPKRLYN